MPPRRSALLAPAVEDATTALTSLPLSVVLHIFSLLPVDCRLRCAEVCRSWRSVLLERSLWTRLVLTFKSGVTAGDDNVDADASDSDSDDEGRWDSLLRCAAARAGGGLQSLQVDTCCVTHTALLEVATANVGTLRELRSNDEVGFADAEAVLRAAPLLQVFATDLICEAPEMQAVRRALRNEAPFGPLRVRHLRANFYDVEAGIEAFADEMAAHASLSKLELEDARLGTPAALDAVVDAALARRMHTVILERCLLTPASAPALARLLSSGALKTLEVSWMVDQLLDAPAAAVLAAALRANSTLTSLALDNVAVWRDPDAAAELLGALHGHASLRVLSLVANHAEAAADRAAAGVALGALIAANTPALTHLDVSDCALGDHGLRALFEALPHNTHLRKLFCDDNGMSGAFARDVLLPAVRANTSLWELDTGMTCDYALEAEALVRRPRPRRSVSGAAAGGQ
jgi:hypothetical protein